ncbi:MAG: phytochelatin synthase family protein [Desulfotignum sp.]
MKHIIYLMRSVLYLRYFFHGISRTGGFGPDRAQITRPPRQPSGNLVKDGLYRHHVKQFHESSCSVASVACVVNTLLEIQGRLPETPVTQQDLLNRVTTAHWKERMGPDGYQGRRGLPLQVLGQVVAASLAAFNVAHGGVTVVQAARDPVEAAACRQTLWSRLQAFETRGDRILIAHFDQGSLVPDLNIPHISPVGGFDAASGRVTMLDVDPSHPHPYTVSFNRFYRAVSTDYLHLFHLFGYGRGGYIHIRL